jgi:RecA-family ATPase
MSGARCAASIEPRDIAWFWKPYLPRGMLSLLDGDPGCGKSYLTLSLAAALSTGRPFPGVVGRPRSPRPSLICSAEDPAEEVIVPRLRALDADLTLVHILDSRALDRFDDDGKRVLRRTLGEVRPHLFTIDTIIPYLPPGVGTQQATDVRPTLRWLADLTNEYSTCGLVLRHLRKAEGDNPLHAGQGTMDFIGTCRSTWLAANDPTDPSSRVLAHNKNEHQRERTELALRICRAGTI